MRNDAFDEALKKRLAKLSTLPVEMAGIEEAVRRQIKGIAEAVSGQFGGSSDAVSGQIKGSAEVASRQKTGAPEEMPARVYRFPRFWKTAVGIAASIALVAIVGMAFLQSRPAEASLMVQLHRDIVAGKIATMKVDSMAEVNEAFKAFGKHGIQMNAPDIHVMSCCLHDVGSKQVYCVLLQEGNVPVTLTIADLNAVQAARGGTVMYKGEAFGVTTSAELTMVTVDRGGHRVCLIGALSAERLMGLAEGLKF